MTQRQEAADPYRSLREDIVDGRLAPGEQLTEMQLAARLNVSRTPVREALRRLEQDGLVERAGRGMRVRRRSPEEILEIYEARVVLEAAVARGAAERRTSYDLILLREALERMVAVPRDAEPTAFAQANRDFHRIMWHAGHNRTLTDLLDRIAGFLGRYPSTTLTHPGRWEEAIAEHGALLEAIERGDGDAAWKAATDHMTRARDIRLRMFARGEP